MPFSRNMCSVHVINVINGGYKLKVNMDQRVQMDQSSQSNFSLFLSHEKILQSFSAVS